MGIFQNFIYFVSWVFEQYLEEKNVWCYQYHVSSIPCKWWSIMLHLVKNGSCPETSWILEIEPILFMFKLGYRVLLIISLIICDIVLWIDCLSFFYLWKCLLFFILMWNNYLGGLISVKFSCLKCWFLIRSGNRESSSSQWREISISREQLILPSVGQSCSFFLLLWNQSLLSRYWTWSTCISFRQFKCKCHEPRAQFSHFKCLLHLNIFGKAEDSEIWRC